jgi:hypothetical protein
MVGEQAGQGRHDSPLNKLAHELGKFLHHAYKDYAMAIEHRLVGLDRAARRFEAEISVPDDFIAISSSWLWFLRG